MIQPPEHVTLTSEEGEALLDRVYASNLARADCRVLVRIIRLHFWLLLAIQEAKLSLKRFRTMLFGEPRRRRAAAAADVPSAASDAQDASSAPTSLPSSPPLTRGPRGGHRAGQGRLGAEAYRGAAQAQCHHEELSVGERCPLCGYGRLYRLPPGVQIRIDGHALLSAMRYELEKLRCSACGAVFTAKLPGEAGAEKYSPRARAVLAIGRYYLGIPLYRMEAYQAMLGVPVADSTQWDQIEALANRVYPVFEQLLVLAAQGDVIYQDDTPARILSVMRATRQAQAVLGPDLEPEGRSGVHTTGLVVQVGERRICLSFTGTAHAGDNLGALLRQRPSELADPLVMSDALSSNHASEDRLIRCHCLAHSHRKFRELEEVFPQEVGAVCSVFKQVFEHDEQARQAQMSPAQRLAYHRELSAPLMDGRKGWLERQFAERNIEPNSSLGKAIRYTLGHWETLTQFLRLESAPITNNVVERALKLFIRQRKNSLFYASEHSAYIASLLTSLIATCIEAGVNALDYLVALQDNRKAVFAHPEEWLPWCWASARASP